MPKLSPSMQRSFDNRRLSAIPLMVRISQVSYWPLKDSQTADFGAFAIATAGSRTITHPNMMMKRRNDISVTSSRWPRESIDTLHARRAGINIYVNRDHEPRPRHDRTAGAGAPKAVMSGNTDLTDTSMVMDALEGRIMRDSVEIRLSPGRLIHYCPADRRRCPLKTFRH